MRAFVRNLGVAPFAAALGFLAVVSGVRGVVDPDVFPVHSVMHGWDYAWGVVYAVGGTLLVLGMGLRRSNIEAAGCILFFAGAVVEALAFLAFLGWTKTTSWLTVVILLIFALAAVARFWQIAKGKHQIWIRFEDDNEC